MTDNKNVLNVSYPVSYPGAQITKISFTSGKPDLNTLFNPGREEGPRRCFITDASVATLPDIQDFINQFEDGICGNDILLILGSGEPYKTIDSVLEIVKNAVDANFSRKDLFVGIGGGVICDMTGFAASIFKRGIACQFVPTTLLAMVDASIGGKTGCDFENYKNMIGAFWPAKEIFIYPEFVQTLSQAQYRSGLGEAIKTALLFDKELFELFKTEPEKILARDKEIVFNLIQKCAKAKAEVVEKDLTEKNIRMYLNLGHTFGHALETLSGLGNIPHGDAVAWGIAREAVLCAREDICSESFKDEVLSVLDKYGWCIDPIHPLITGGGIGERLMTIMKKDKKNASSKIKLVLQRGLNDTFTEEIEDSKILSVLK